MTKTDQSLVAEAFLNARKVTKDDVQRYCTAFADPALRGMKPETFARLLYSMAPRACADILDRIGMHPSSEPELAALQRVAR